MGWKSTIMLSEKQAKEQLQINLSCLLENIEKLDNEKICDLLEYTYGGESHGYNYMIADVESDFLPRFEV